MPNLQFCRSLFCRVTEEMGLQQQLLAVTMALVLPAENVAGGRLLQWTWPSLPGVLFRQAFFDYVGLPD